MSFVSSKIMEVRVDYSGKGIWSSISGNALGGCDICNKPLRINTT